AGFRGLWTDGAGRALRAVHLRGHFADPAGARPHQVAGVGAHLDQYSAGACLGLPETLTTEDRRQTADKHLICPLSSVLCRLNMVAPKILVIPGSLRSGSHNARLAALAARALSLKGADVTHISLADFPLPIYDAGLAKAGMPANAGKLK